MSTLFHKLRGELASSTPVAVATVIATRGSTPREVGARMIIHPYGRHVGTIGGGCGEAEAIRVAVDVLQDGVPRIVTVDLTEPLSRESVGVCGGIVTVFVERWAVDAEAP